MSALQDDVSAITDLISTLEEESISVASDGQVVTALIQTPSGPARCELHCSDPAAYPAASCSVRVVEGASPRLTRLSGQLSKGGVRVATALARLGHLLDVDLDWLEEGARRRAAKISCQQA